MKLSIIEFAKITGKTRQTVWRELKGGAYQYEVGTAKNGNKKYYIILEKEKQQLLSQTFSFTEEELLKAIDITKDLEGYRGKKLACWIYLSNKSKKHKFPISLSTLEIGQLYIKKSQWKYKNWQIDKIILEEQSLKLSNRITTKENLNEFIKGVIRDHILAFQGLELNQVIEKIDQLRKEWIEQEKEYSQVDLEFFPDIAKQYQQIK